MPLVHTGWTMPEHKGDAANPVPTPTAFRSLRVLDLSEPNDVYAPTTSKLTDSIVLRIAVRRLTLTVRNAPSEPIRVPATPRGSELFLVPALKRKCRSRETAFPKTDVMILPSSAP